MPFKASTSLTILIGLAADALAGDAATMEKLDAAAAYLGSTTNPYRKGRPLVAALEAAAAVAPASWDAALADAADYAAGRLPLELLEARWDLLGDRYSTGSRRFAQLVDDATAATPRR